MKPPYQLPVYFDFITPLNKLIPTPMKTLTLTNEEMNYLSAVLAEYIEVVPQSTSTASDLLRIVADMNNA